MTASRQPAPGGQALTTVTEAILANAARLGDKDAVVFGDGALCYRDLGVAIERWGAYLADKVEKQNIVLIFLPQGAEAIVAFFGAMAIGAVPSFMPLPNSKQDPERYWAAHRALLELVTPKVVISTANHAPRLADACRGLDTTIIPIGDVDLALMSESAGSIATRRPQTDDIALLQHSSGTTGLKKGVALTHTAIALQIEAYAAALGATENDSVASWLPLYHDMGLIACTVMPLMLGQTILLLDPFEWVSEPRSLFRTITDHSATWVWLPNFAFDHLRRAVEVDGGHYDLSSVKAFINCSEPCKAATFDRFAQAFASIGVRPEQLQVCYAMAETVFAISQTPSSAPATRLRVVGKRLAEHVVEPDPAGDVELLSCGTLVSGSSVRIQVDGSRPGDADAGRDVGEIIVSAPFLFAGYYRRPEITETVLEAGRYRTRDLGFVHEGELYVLGRKDDLLISNGRNFFAHEIEQIANQVEGIKAGRGVALGIFNPDVGSEEVYLVQEVSDLDSGSARALRRAVRQRVEDALALALRDVVLVQPGWLVKTTSGKISREANHAKLAEHLESRRRTRDRS
ncbi:MAG: AMP-binding protein [Chromatiales bacterium]|nr:AMP-binding protein [Chromatiales bacterium]